MIHVPVRTFWCVWLRHGFRTAARAVSIEQFGIDPAHPRRELPYAWLCE